jgi:hypothetical protein
MHRLLHSKMSVSLFEYAQPLLDDAYALCTAERASPALAQIDRLGEHIGRIVPGRGQRWASLYGGWKDVREGRVPRPWLSQ